MYCELYLTELATGTKYLISTAEMNSDYSAGGVPIDLSVAPTALYLKGQRWSGTVQINGAGYPGVLRILSNAPVEIDLGAGPSETGLDFETTIRGDSDKVVAYRGPMTISGTMARPGVQHYTIKLVYELT